MKTLKIVGYIFAGVQLFASIAALYIAMSTTLVPTKYAIIGGVALLVVLAFVVMMATIKKKGTKIASIIISLMMIGLLLVGCYFISIANKAMDDVTGVTVEVDEVNVYVSKDDVINSINEAVANEYVFGTVATDDLTHVNETISKINSDLGTTITTKEYPTIFELIEDFEAGNVKSLISSSGTILVLDSTEDYLDYSTKLKTIMETTYKEEIATEEEAAIDLDHFCVYFSGIDTFGSVTVRSRSDVNIIGVVNNSTKTILLLSTPRDYYVPISVANGRKDKLTHTGIYGIDCSTDTLENFYDTDIPYYVRVNFSGFQSIIDKLGGIDVYSEMAFTSETAEGTYSYTEGINHLNGEEALGFARARYAFIDGDRQRGRNQMAVIKATIEKLESSDMLKNYGSIMDDMDGSFQTDMQKDDIGYLVQSTLDGGNWQVLTCSVSGTDSTQVCYSLGQEAYVMEPYQEDVLYATNLIDKVLAGEAVTQDDINAYLASRTIDETSEGISEEDLESGE
ncbi:MAG: LCP family protein [Eubacterium sp.]|nr:LCP family protein [Eubacterium sp.]